MGFLLAIWCSEWRERPVVLSISEFGRRY